MGKITGFLEYERMDNQERPADQRIHDYNEFHQPLPAQQRRQQAARCMNCGVPYCQWGQPVGRMTAGCPLSNLIPEFNDAIWRGDEGQALHRLLKMNCFPEFTGRVCPALCEKACTCGLNGDPVSIKDNEYDVIEQAFQNGLMQPQSVPVHSGKKVAVVGSGPSGLACAEMLSRRGHQVTVLEKNDRFGGLMMYGIPNMKLDKNIIARRIDLMRREGIVFQADTWIQTPAQAAQLQQEYDAVVLCCGSGKPRPLSLPQADLPGVLYAVDFLRESTRSLLNHSEPLVSAHGRRVIVLGGGDTGNDCIGVCLRQGCAEIRQLEIMPEPPTQRLPENPWPEWPIVKKTDYGQQEAAAVFHKDPRQYQTTVSQLYQQQGKLCAVDLVQVEKTVDQQGHMVLRQLPATAEKVSCDLLLIAMGFAGCQEDIVQAFSLVTHNGRAAETGYRIHDNLFTAGDMRRGQSLVVYAILEGRECAKAVDHFLMGY